MVLKPLFIVAKLHWRNFVPLWIFTIVFFLGDVLLEASDHQKLFFNIALPLYLVCFFAANLPWFRGKVPYNHCTFWTILFPVIIWGVAIFTRISVIRIFS